MSFTFTDQSYIEAFWLIGWGVGDWLAVVYRDTPESPWQAKYRFRYYKSAKVWDSDDVKSWYDIKTNDSDPAARAATTGDELAAAFDKVAALMAKEMRRDFPGRSVKLIKRVIRGDMKRMMDEFMKTGFGHKLVVPYAAEPTRPQ